MMHLLLDLYGCSPNLLADEAHLRRFLNEIPGHIQMQQVSPVELRSIDQTSDPRDAGYSGFVIIATSHCSLHAWPPFRMVNIDIFSCNEFDEAEAVAFARAMFGPADIEKNLVYRATRSPRQSVRVSVSPTPVPDAVTHNEGRLPVVTHRCLYRGPGGCFISTGSAWLKYCDMHKDMLLQP